MKGYAAMPDEENRAFAGALARAHAWRCVIKSIDESLHFPFLMRCAHWPLRERGLYQPRAGNALPASENQQPQHGKPWVKVT